MSNPCYTSSPNPCPTTPNAKCIPYTGANLSAIGVITNDRLDVILGKINDAITSGPGSSLFIQAGTGINITGAGTSGNPKVISSTITQYTTENAQDDIASLVTNSASITWTYNDVTPSLIANVDNSYIRTLFTGGSGIIYDPNTGTITNNAQDTNFAQNNLTATSNISHNWTGNNLSIIELGTFILQNTGSSNPNILLNATTSKIAEPSNSRSVQLDNTGIFVAGLTNLSTQNQLIGQNSSTNQLGYITIGSNLSLSSGVLSSTGAPATGGTGYIQNQFSAAQSSSNFWISANGRADGYFQIGNAARLVTDSQGLLSVANPTNSSLGADLRVDKLRFFSNSTSTLSDSRIYAEATSSLTLEATTNVLLRATSLTFPLSTPTLDVLANYPLRVKGASGSAGVRNYLELYNNNTGTNDDSRYNYLVYSLNRTTGGTTNYARIGAYANDFSNLAYKGDLVFETADGAVPVERMRIGYDGQITIQNIPNATTNTNKFLVQDGTTVKYRTGTELRDDLDIRLSNIKAASASNTINSSNFKQEWQWNSLASNVGLKLSAATTGSNEIRLFESALSGTHSSSNGTISYAGYFSNTRNGSGTVNIALYAAASGVSNNSNYAGYFDGFVQMNQNVEIRDALTLRNGNNYTSQIFAHAAGEGMHVRVPYQLDNSSKPVLRLTGQLVSAAQIGFGVQQLFESFTPIGTSVSMARHEAIYTSVTPNNENVDYTIGTRSAGAISDKIKIFSNGTIRFNNAFTFPAIDGSVGQAIVTNGSGTLSWATIGGGGPVPTLQQVLTAGSTLTGNNVINAGGFDVTINNNDLITLGTTAAQILLDNAGQDVTITATDKTFLKIAAFGSATNGDVLTLIDNTTGEVGWTAGGGGGGGVSSFSAGNLSPLFTSNVATATTTPALTFSLTNAAAHTYFGNATASSGAPSYTANAALTKTDDTNVTLTLGGAPTTALLEATSITVGWTGTLGVARGGTNIASYAVGDILIATGTTTLSKLAIGTATQQLRVNAGATALEYFTPTAAINSLNGLTATTQTFATGTSGSDFNISSTTSTHTFNIPSASASARGLVTTGAQIFEGVKTHNVGTIINETGADSDTRIEGDTQVNLLFVDASTDRIGIATATPETLLHISQGTNSITATITTTSFFDVGSSNLYGAEFKGSAASTGILVTNTSGSGIPFYQLHNVSNNKFWTQTLDTDNGFSIKEGGSGGTTRLKFAASSGTITATGNLALVNKINSYNNTSILNGELLIGHTANGTFEKTTLTGTTNQITFTSGAGSVTASLPQNIHTTATPQFGGLGIGATAILGGFAINIGGSGYTNGITMTPSISAPVGSSPAMISVSGTIIEASSGTHNVIAGISISAPTITPAAASVTNAATLFVNNATSATVTGGNYSILVASGTSRFNGDVVIGSGTTYSTGGYDIAVRNTTTGRIEVVQNDVIPINAQTGTAYTLVAADRGLMVKMNNASINTLTVPTNATVAFPVGTEIVVMQEGAGQTSIAGSGGVTINSPGGALKLRLQYSLATLIKTATNTWVLSGDITT